MSVLRALLTAIAIAVLVAGLWLLIAGLKGPGLYLLLIGAALLVGTLFERWRYRPPAPPEGARWQRTGERFEDPQTGRIVEVLYDPGSGQRRYAGADEEHDGHSQGNS